MRSISVDPDARDGLSRIIHGFHIEKAPRVRQIGTRTAKFAKF
jgi:hypothetical protein